MSRVFANGPGNHGSIPYQRLALPNSHYHKVRIKGNTGAIQRMENPKLENKSVGKPTVWIFQAINSQD